MEIPDFSDVVQRLGAIEKIIFSLTKESIQETTEAILKLANPNFLFSYDFLVSRMILSFYVSNQSRPTTLILEFLQSISSQQNSLNIVNIFAEYLADMVYFEPSPNEANYLLDKMVEMKMIQPNIVENLSIDHLYFVHRNRNYNLLFNPINSYFYNKFEFATNLNDLVKNDLFLHKEYVKNGVYPIEEVNIIRKDDVEELKKRITQSNYNPRQLLKLSLYERCAFLDKSTTTLVDCCAYFGSIKCYKYLMSIGGILNLYTGSYAIVGGDQRIYKHCIEAENSKKYFTDPIQVAIKFHRYDIFIDLFEKRKISIDLSLMIRLCIEHDNYEILSYLFNNGYIIKDNKSLMCAAASCGNLELFSYFLGISREIPKDILLYACKSSNTELVKFILDKDEDLSIDTNAKDKVGKTPLEIAAGRGLTDTVKLLLQRKDISINGKQYSQTPLIIAALQLEKEILMSLSTL